MATDYTHADARRVLNQFTDSYNTDTLLRAFTSGFESVDALYPDEPEQLAEIAATLPADEIARKLEAPGMADQIEAAVGGVDTVSTDFGALEPQRGSDDDTTDTRQQTTIAPDAVDDDPEPFPTRPDRATREAMRSDDTRQQGLGGGPTREESARATEQARERQQRAEQRADPDRGQRSLAEMGQTDRSSLDQFTGGGGSGGGGGNGSNERVPDAPDEFDMGSPGSFTHNDYGVGDYVVVNQDAGVRIVRVEQLLDETEEDPNGGFTGTIADPLASDVSDRLGDETFSSNLRIIGVAPPGGVDNSTTDQFTSEDYSVGDVVVYSDRDVTAAARVTAKVPNAEAGLDGFEGEVVDVIETSGIVSTMEFSTGKEFSGDVSIPNHLITEVRRQPGNR